MTTIYNENLASADFVSGTSKACTNIYTIWDIFRVCLSRWLQQTWDVCITLFDGRDNTLDPNVLFDVAHNWKLGNSLARDAPS